MSDDGAEAEPAAADTAPGRVSIGEIFLTFLVIGATSFGGGVVAYLRNSLVARRRWLDDDGFLACLEISQALPGLNATNMAVIVGDRLRGVRGALAGLLGMTLPGAAVVLGLSILYAEHADNPAVNSVLKGIGAASVGLLLAVTLQVGHKQLEHALDVSLVVVTLVLISFLHVSLVIVLLTVVPVAVVLFRPRPDRTLAPHHPGLDKRPAD